MAENLHFCSNSMNYLLFLMRKLFWSPKINYMLHQLIVKTIIYEWNKWYHWNGRQTDMAHCTLLSMKIIVKPHSYSCIQNHFHQSFCLYEHCYKNWKNHKTIVLIIDIENRIQVRLLFSYHWLKVLANDENAMFLITLNHEIHFNLF